METFHREQMIKDALEHFEETRSNRRRSIKRRDQRQDEKLKRQGNLYQGSKTTATCFLLHRTGTAGIQIDKIAIFCTPDVFL